MQNAFSSLQNNFPRHSKVMSLFPKFAYARGAYDVSLKDKTVPATYAFDGNTTILC